MYKSKNVRVESPLSPTSPLPQENLEDSNRVVETVSPLINEDNKQQRSGLDNDNANSLSAQNTDNNNTTPEIIDVNTTALSHEPVENSMPLPNIIDIAEEMIGFDSFSLFPRTRLQEAVRDAHLFAARDELLRDMTFSRPSEWFSNTRTFHTSNNPGTHFMHMETENESLFSEWPFLSTPFITRRNANRAKRPFWHQRVTVDENVMDSDEEDNNGNNNNKKKNSNNGNSEEEMEERSAIPVEDVVPVTKVNKVSNAETRSTNKLPLPRKNSNTDNKDNVSNNNSNNTFLFTNKAPSTYKEHNELPKERELHMVLIDDENYTNNCDDQNTTHMTMFNAILPEQTEVMAKVNNDCIALSDPYTSALPANCEPGHHERFNCRRLLQCECGSSNLSTVLYNLSRTFYLQLAFIIFYVVCMALVFAQVFSGRGEARWFTTYVSFLFAIDLIVVCSYMKLARFQRLDQYWHIAEPFVTALLFILECLAWEIWDVVKYEPSIGFRVLASIRLLLWILHSRTRWEQFVLSLRCFCSADRRRYQANGFDLDLSFIHRNIVAMAWPANNFEQLFRNPLGEVALFLDTLYPNAYCAINLSSERTYHPSLFHHHTAWFAMDDHNPTELRAMLQFCEFCSSYIACDPLSRVIAVHCKGGKGRTGTMIAALLMYMGLARNAEEALHHFAAMRTLYGKSTFQGVQAPSQGRYVRYFETLLNSAQCQDTKHEGNTQKKQNNTWREEELSEASMENRPYLHRCVIPHRQRQITSLWLRDIPPMWYLHGIGKLWFAIILKPSSEREVVFLSNESVQFNSALPDPSTYTAKQFRDLFATDEDNFYREANAIMNENDATYTNNNYNSNVELQRGRNTINTNIVNNQTSNVNENLNSEPQMSHKQQQNYTLDKNSFWFHVKSKEWENEEYTRMNYSEFEQFIKNEKERWQTTEINNRRDEEITDNTENKMTIYSKLRATWQTIIKKIKEKTTNSVTEQLKTYKPTFEVTLEYKETQLLPEVNDDVVLKFFYARNNPNTLEVPVQFWFHTALEKNDTLEFTRNELDGPSKDVRFKRYPAGFTIVLTLTDVAESDDEHY